MTCLFILFNSAQIKFAYASLCHCWYVLITQSKEENKIRRWKMKSNVPSCACLWKKYHVWISSGINSELSHLVAFENQFMTHTSMFTSICVNLNLCHNFRILCGAFLFYAAFVGEIAINYVPLFRNNCLFMFVVKYTQSNFRQLFFIYSLKAHFNFTNE